MAQLLGSVWQLALSWWQTDRPRASPREGRLLRLAPPAILRIDERLFEVVSRTVGESAAGPFVTYACRCGEAMSELRVSPAGSDFVASVHWTQGGREVELSEDDVEVYCTPASRER